MSKLVAAWVAALAAVVVIALVTVVAVSTRDDEGEAGTIPMMGTGSDGVEGWTAAGGGGEMMLGDSVEDEFAYLTHMVAHHEEAVDVARELERSERPRMQELGRSIVASQSAQIEQMESWLQDWYPGEETDVDYTPMMRDLTGLSADELDQRFLQDMIVHHMAAVMMSQRLLAGGAVDHPEVAALAQTIRDEQHAEMLQMRRWLVAWFGEGWQHGWNGSHPGWPRMGPEMMQGLATSPDTPGRDGD
jgi:uncharacterized protein (DUF305 family)